MSRYTLGACMLMLAGPVIAQEPLDGLRTSWNVPSGTARSQAVGGAIGALGGDVTSAFVNPAGLGFYRTGDLVFSPVFRFGNTTGNYLGTTTKQDYNRLGWGTTGFVVGSGQKKKNSAFGIAINRMADYNGYTEYMGRNYQSSISNKFLEAVANTGDGNLVAGDPSFAFGAGLAFNTYLIDTIGGSTNGNFKFKSRSLPLLGQGLLQSRTVSTHGGIDEIAISGGGFINDKFMVGGSFGIPIMHYNRVSDFVEADPTTISNGFDQTVFTERLRTTGVGFNVKAGIIYRPTEFVRLGFAAHSPTIYSLRDRFSAEMTTNTEGYKGNLTQSSEDIVNDDYHQFRYTYYSPYKLIGSVAIVLRETEDVSKQRGFITADVEYVNHKASSYGVSEEYTDDEATKSYLKSVNRAVDAAYKGAFNFRAGAELKFTTLMVRLGAAYYGNPYQGQAGDKGDRLNLSGGLGYRNKGFFIDLTYVHSIVNDKDHPYTLRNMPYPTADMKTINGTALLTFGIKI